MIAVAGYPLWADALERGGAAGERGRGERVEVRFVGRGPVARPAHEELLEALEPEPPRVAWAKQIHSARVLAAASPGDCGEGDALVSTQTGLALAVVTADCVPILLASHEPGGPIAAVHAGWRGIAAGIVAATLARMEDTWQAPAPALTAWIGPAIGPCCYEVGEEVAERVARAAADPRVIRPNPDPARPNPHLDLHEAVRSQLAQAGVSDVRTVELCTRCHPAEVWSYRREGQRAGRNFGFLWIRDLSAVEG